MEQQLSYITALGVAALAVCTDTRRGLIPNRLTFPALFLGVAIHTLLGGWSGFMFAVEGAGVGLGLFLLPFLIGGMGAGDVKLLAALGAFLGVGHIVVAFSVSVTLGGILGLWILVKEFGLTGTFVTMFHSWRLLLSSAGRTTRLEFPFASAIFFGVFTSLFVM